MNTGKGFSEILLYRIKLDCFQDLDLIKVYLEQNPNTDLLQTEKINNFKTLRYLMNLEPKKYTKDLCRIKLYKQYEGLETQIQDFL